MVVSILLGVQSMSDQIPEGYEIAELHEDGEKKVNDGITTKQEVMRVSEEA